MKFLTRLNDKEIFFDVISTDLSTVGVNEKVVLYIHTIKRNRDGSVLNEILTSIQQPNVIGIVLYQPQNVLFEREIEELYQRFEVPVIQVREALKREHLDGGLSSAYNEMAKEIRTFKGEDKYVLVESIAKATNLPLIFLDHVYKLTWKSSLAEEDPVFTQWVNEQRPQWIQSFYYDAEAFLQKSICWTQENNAGLIEKFPIYSVEGIKEFVLSPHDVSNWKKNWLHKLVSLISMNEQKNDELEQVNEKFKHHFVYDLIYNNFNSQTTIIEQGKAWGWNFERPHHLAILDVDLNDALMSNSQWREEMIQYIKVNFNERGDSFVIDFQDQLVIFVEETNLMQRTIQKKEIKTYFKKMISSCEEKWPEYFFSIGVGKCYRQTKHLNKSFQEAKMALQLGHEWSKEENVFHIEDLGVLRLLFYLNKDQLVDFSNEYLEPLLVSDRDNSTEYVKTIKYFILYDLNIQEAAKGLFIHQNTLRKRIKKINELIGLDVYNHEDFINLSIAVKIHSIGYLQ